MKGYESKGGLIKMIILFVVVNEVVLKKRKGYGRWIKLKINNFNFMKIVEES